MSAEERRPGVPSGAGTALLGGVELGGTKIVCVVGRGDSVLAEHRIPTGDDPVAALAAVVAFFRAQAGEGRAVAAIGVASFGPVELRAGKPRWGHVTDTPKPGWSGADVARPVREALGVPVAFDTDVAGAALAEGRHGVAAGLDTFVYLTVGTGIGGGAVVGGRVAHGLVHAEMGHVSVPREPGDAFPGRCPFHGDCLEGMACGPALEARFGGAPLASLAPADQLAAATLAARYVASGLRNVVYVLAPERIVIGGGVSQLEAFVPLVRERLRELVGRYPGLPEHAADDFVVPAALGDRAGPVGALLLAETAR
jgi:fructokinase